MENDLKKYQVYQYIENQELPEIVKEHFLTNIDASGEGYQRGTLKFIEPNLLKF